MTILSPMLAHCLLFWLVLASAVCKFEGCRGGAANASDASTNNRESKGQDYS